MSIHSFMSDEWTVQGIYGMNTEERVLTHPFNQVHYHYDRGAGDGEEKL